MPTHVTNANVSLYCYIWFNSDDWNVARVCLSLWHFAYIQIQNCQSLTQFLVFFWEQIQSEICSLLLRLFIFFKRYVWRTCVPFWAIIRFYLIKNRIHCEQFVFINPFILVHLRSFSLSLSVSLALNMFFFSKSEFLRTLVQIVQNLQRRTNALRKM